MTPLSKTNYILWRECAKNAWLKIHKPEIYFASELTDFEKQIIETGNEVDELARNILPNAEYQKKFEIDGFLAITDIFVEDKVGVHVYEVKATNEIDKKTHYHDLAFQVSVIEKSGLKVQSANLIHLNAEYMRAGELDLKELFTIENVTDLIREMLPEVEKEMQIAKDYLAGESEPKGPCSCIYKGRSNHCSTFSYSNPNVPNYSVHDLARIGLSKKKLTELIDSGILHPHELPESTELSDIQKNQIWTLVNDRTILSKEAIGEELESLEFPLYFLDYETFPAAIPRFSGYSPYQQIPFQYSLHVLTSLDAEPEHYDFLYTEQNDPSESFAKSLMGHIGPKGSVIVWHKSFECNRNKEIGERVPGSKKFFEEVNARTYDLEDIFKKQHYVHKDFKGSSSIKKILPVLAPTLSYSELEIKEGGTAAESWNRIISTQGRTLSTDSQGSTLDSGPALDTGKIAQNLREYCKLDTYAMYAVWRELHKLIN